MKNKFYQSTEGTIIDIKSKGLDFPTIITVAYEVQNKQYQISESLKLKNEVIKIGFLPIGQKRTPKIKNIGIGEKVKVSYDTTSPEKAYLSDNKGIINV